MAKSKFGFQPLGRRSGRYGPVLALVLAAAVGVMFFFSRWTRSMVVEQNNTYLREEARQTEKFFDTIFLNSKHVISTIAFMYEQQMTGPELDLSKFQQISGSTPFSYITLAGSDGVAVDINGNTADVSDRGYFAKGMKGEVGVEAVFGARFSGDTSLFAYAPLRYQGKVVGVFAGAHDEQWITEMLKRSTFEEETKAMLCLSDGTVFGTSSEELIRDRVNLPDFYRDKGLIDRDTYWQLRQSFQERREFSFSYTASGGFTESAYSVPNSRGTWIMIQTFPHSVSEKMISAYNGGIIRAEAVCLALFLLYVVYVIAFEIRQRRLHAEHSRRLLYKSSVDLADAVSVLSDLYYKVLKVNLADDSFEIIKQNADEQVEEGISTSQWIEKFADEGHIFIEDIGSYMEFYRPKELMRRLSSGEDRISVRYRRIFGGAFRWVRMVIMRSSEYSARRPVVLLYVLDINDEVSRELALEEAYESAMKANNAKTSFLSSMSHDIRTPMNAIIGMTAIAEMHLDEPERVSDCLKKITVSSNHLLGLINEVLDMSKIESGRIDLQKEEFNLSSLIDNLFSMSRTQIKAKGHELVVSIKDVRHELVVGDSQRIQQVFMNLLSNAIKYTPDGGKIGITITERATNREDIGCYEIVFEDNGIGMSEEYRKRLFEPFCRNTDDERVKKIQGTGLGLTICRSIVQMMNGDIKVESEPDKGTKFTVTIFLELQNSAADEGLESFRGVSVLVVDDEQASCETAAAMLGSFGIRCEWLLSGSEAVELAESRQKAGEGFFAIILDWKMPGMDGIEATREIRRRIGGDTPIIIISAYDWSDIEDEARAAGANDFVSKPLFRSRLSALLKRLAGREAEPAPATSLRDFENSNFSGRRALLVEDNEINLEIAEEILRTARLEVEVARDGREAVEKFASVPDGYYDIIFMDVQMPVMNGYEAALAIRAMDRDYARRVPIVAMTANTFSDDVVAARNAGMNEHIAKPLKLDLLMNALRQWVGGEPHTSTPPHTNVKTLRM